MGMKKDMEALQGMGCLVIYDLETDGLSPERDLPIQVAAQKFRLDAGKLIPAGSLNIFINQGKGLPGNITALTGITDGFLKGHGVSEDEAFHKINAFFSTPARMQETCVCGYNNHAFDDRFMRALYGRHGGEFSPGYSADVFKMAKELIPGSRVKNYKLATVADCLGVSRDIDFHTADGDVAATAGIFKILMDGYGNMPRKEDAKIFSINYWKGYNHKMQRIYVDTDQGSLWYSTIYRKWGEKIPGVLERIDIGTLEERVVELTGCGDMDGFVKFRGNLLCG